MIGSFMEGLRQLARAMQLWVTISPWEQGLRVRVGRHVTLLYAGIHLKLPFLDVLYIQSVRMRMSSAGRQTVTTKDGKAVTFDISIGYAIADIERLYRTLHQAEDTLRSLTRARAADAIARTTSSELLPCELESNLGAALDAEMKQYGISDVQVFLTDFVMVRTYRLVGDYGQGSFGDALVTTRSTAAPPM